MDIRVVFLLLAACLVVTLGFEDFGGRRDHQRVNSRRQDSGRRERVKTREGHHERERQHRGHHRRYGTFLDTFITITVICHDTAPLL